MWREGMCSASLVGPPTLFTRKRDGLMTTGIPLRRQAGRAVASLVVTAARLVPRARPADRRRALVASLAATAALLVLGGASSQTPADASPWGSLPSPTAAQTRHELDRRADSPLGDSRAPAATSASQRTLIAIGERAFVSPETVVPVGTTVSWWNLGREQHTATSPGIWDSGPLRTQQIWSALFAVPGTFEYVCSIHPAEMSGRIVVTEASGAAVAPRGARGRPAGGRTDVAAAHRFAGARGRRRAAARRGRGAATVAGYRPGVGIQATPTTTEASRPDLPSPPALAADSRCPPGSRCSPTEPTGPPNSLLANVDAGSGPTAAAVASLSPLAGSGVSGEAALLRSGGETIVTISLRGMAPNTAYAGHVHAAGCAGPILFALGTIVADRAGEGHASATASAPIDPSEWWIAYQTEPMGGSIACGPVNAAR